METQCTISNICSLQRSGIPVYCSGELLILQLTVFYDGYSAFQDFLDLLDPFAPADNSETDGKE